MLNTTINACKFLNGSEKNPLADWFINYALPTFADRKHFHPCPYIEEDVILVPTKIPFTNLIRGKYNFIMRIFNQKDSEIITIQIQLSIG
jgi:hypothetical protein